jgi:hypothetical protein
MIPLIPIFMSIFIHISTAHGGYREVFVKTCEGEWASIYADKKMTILLPNPMVSNADGSYEFYSPSACLSISEERNWKESK